MKRANNCHRYNKHIPEVCPKKKAAGRYFTHSLLAAALLFLTAFIIFSHSAALRKPWLGSLYSHFHINLTAHTLFFAKNWYREGPLNLKFASIESLKSIETPDITKSPAYVSWPPGHLLPIHIIAKITRQEPSARLIMIYNLTNHFLTAVFLSLTLFFLLIQIDFKIIYSFLLSTIPIFIMLFMPGNLWYFLIVYQNPQAVLFPMVLFIFLEVIRDYRINKTFLRIIHILQFFVFFYGALTAYIFYMLAFVVYLKRILNNEIGKKNILFLKNSLKFWAPALVGAALFLLQLVYLNGFKQFISRGLQRSGSAGGVDFFVGRFWNLHIIRAFGPAGKYLILFSLLFVTGFLLHALINNSRQIPNSEKNKKVLSLAAVTLFPCFIHIFLLRDFTYHHGFTALKFSIPLAVLPFVLIPVSIYLYLQPVLRKYVDFSDTGSKPGRNTLKTVMTSTFVMLLLFSSLLYTLSEYRNSSRFFNEKNTARVYKEKIRPYVFIGRNTGYRDIVFSPGIEVNRVNKVPLIHTMNMIYKIYSIHDIYNKVKTIKAGYVVNIFLNKSDKHAPYIRFLTAKARQVRQSGDWQLLKIDKNSFLSSYKTFRKKMNRRKYTRQRGEMEKAKRGLKSALQGGNYTEALRHNEQVTRFIEQFAASPYNPKYYLMKVALLHKLGQHEDAKMLMDELEKKKFLYQEEPMWGWDPEPYTTNLLLSDGMIWNFLNKKH